ncbi:hypothetical protein [Nostoc sp. KVJ3]|nr:hypothetical protein [Nostoc sp. KVJ3]
MKLIKSQGKFFWLSKKFARSHKFIPTLKEGVDFVTNASRGMVL